MCVSTHWCYKLSINYWRSAFIVQIGLSIAITVLLYGTIYFWITFGFFVFYYALALIFSFVMWIWLTREEYNNPFVSYFLPCMILFDFTKEDCCNFLHGKPCWYSCIVCSLTPFLIYMIFTPFYIFAFMIIASKHDIHDTAPQIGIICYLLPQNVLHIVILMNYNNNDIVLYSLLIICIFLSIFWYISICFIIFFKQNTDERYEEITQGLIHWLSSKLIWYAMIIEAVLILMVFIIYIYFKTDMNNYYIFNVITTISGIIAIPTSMPIFCAIYHYNTSIKNGFYELWMTSFDSNILYDKIYVTLHLSSHDSMDTALRDRMLTKESSSLLLSNNDNEPLINAHISCSMTCIQYQYNYFKLSIYDRKKYIDQFVYYSILQRVATCCKIQRFLLMKIIFMMFFMLYFISRIYILFIFPCYWYFYIYLYEINFYIFCNGHIECVQSLFITAIILILIVFEFLFLRTLIILLRHEYWFGYLMNDWQGTLMECEIFLGNMQRNEAVFHCLQHDIAVLVCLFIEE